MSTPATKKRSRSAKSAASKSRSTMDPEGALRNESGLSSSVVLRVLCGPLWLKKSYRGSVGAMDLEQLDSRLSENRVARTILRVHRLRSR